MPSPKARNSLARKRPLGSLFSLYNRRYFRGTLPRYKIQRRRAVRQRTNPRELLLGEIDRERRSIYIRQGLSRKMVRAVMIHEMVHIRQLGHSTRFFCFLLDLAAAGCSAARLAAQIQSTCTRKEVDAAVLSHMALYPRGEVIRHPA